MTTKEQMAQTIVGVLDDKGCELRHPQGHTNWGGGAKQVRHYLECSPLSSASVRARAAAGDQFGEIPLNGKAHDYTPSQTLRILGSLRKVVESGEGTQATNLRGLGLEEEDFKEIALRLFPSEE